MNKNLASRLARLGARRDQPNALLRVAPGPLSPEEAGLFDEMLWSAFEALGLGPLFAPV